MKPCPLCGEDDEDEGLTVTSRVARSIIMAHVECLTCGARGPAHYDDDGPKSADDGARWAWDNERQGA